MSLRKKLESTPVKGNLHGPIKAKLDHPDWPEKVYVRQMVGSDARKYEGKLIEIQPKAALDGEDVDPNSAWGLRPFVVCLCLVDSDGHRLFEDGDDSWIDEHLPSSLIYEASDLAFRVNGLMASSVKDEQKNSESGTPSDS